MAPGPITSWQIEEGKGKAVTGFIFLGFKITVDDDCSHKMKRCLFLGGKAMTNVDSVWKKTGTSLSWQWSINSQSCSFSSSCVRMWELDHREGWVLKNWCFWMAVLETTLESPLDCKEIKPVNPKGHQPWIFIRRTDAKVEAPILWPLLWRGDSLEKTLMLGKIEGKKRRGIRGWDD